MAAVRCAALLAVAACASYDLDRPIQLVTASSWSDRDRATLDAATRCWNLQFGVAFELVDKPTTSQVVYFDFDSLACWDSWGRYLPGEPAHDGVCPIPDMALINVESHYEYDQRVLLFTVVEHELGHAANIPDVSSDDVATRATAVMIENRTPSLVVSQQAARPAFTPFDVEQLAAANSGFVARPVCDGVLVYPDPATDVACICP